MNCNRVKPNKKEHLHVDTQRVFEFILKAAQLFKISLDIWEYFNN